jgi:hypothetical protein
MFVMQAAKRNIMSRRRPRKPTMVIPVAAKKPSSRSCAEPVKEQHQAATTANALEVLAIKHFARGILRVAMYNDNMELPSYERLPGWATGKPEPFGYLRYCPTADIALDGFLCTVRDELNKWWYATQARVQQTATDARHATDPELFCSDDSESITDELMDESVTESEGALEYSCESSPSSTCTSRHHLTRTSSTTHVHKSSTQGYELHNSQCNNNGVDGYYARVSPGMRVLLVAMIYVDRLTSASSRRARLCTETMHRIVLCAVELAARTMWSPTPTTKWFAALGCVDKQELRKLGKLFCAIVPDFQVSTDQFQHCVDKCVSLMEHSSGK